MLCDAATLPVEWAGSFDWVTTFMSLHDMCFPQKVLDECFRVLKSGGKLTVIEIEGHSNALYNKINPMAAFKSVSAE